MLHERLDQEIRERKAAGREWHDLLERYGASERIKRGEGLIPVPPTVYIEARIFSSLQPDPPIGGHVSFLEYNVIMSGEYVGQPGRLIHALDFDRAKVFILQLGLFLSWKSPLLDEVFRLAWKDLFQEDLTVTTRWIYTSVAGTNFENDHLAKDVASTWTPYERIVLGG